MTVLGLVAAMGLTWFGLGAKDHAAASFDASSWMWSSLKGELARVNGVTGRVDTRLSLEPAIGHNVQVSQSDKNLIVRDLSSGKLSAVDLATLQISATSQTAPGIGVSIAIDRDAAFLIDPVQGIVQQINPATLAPLGEALSYPPGITGGTFDGAGKLWIAVPSEGTVSAVVPIPIVSASGGQGGGGVPTRVTTVPVAEPSHDLAVSTLDNGVAVLDRTSGKLTTVRGDKPREIGLDLGGYGDMPRRTTGAKVPVTVVDGRHVFVVNDVGAVRDFTVPGDSPRLQPAVSWADRFYVADDANHVIYVLDAEGHQIDSINFKEAGGPLELEVRENRLFINAPAATTARVVDDHGKVKVVEKFVGEVVGAEVPPPPVVTPPKPVPGPPGPPRNVKASAGNAQVRITWTKAVEHLSPIQRYIVEGDGKTWTVAANMRSLVVTGLVNGKSYVFSVRAESPKGKGPARKTPPFMPTSEVPAAPTAVKAVDKPDGTVVVTWSKANGLGRAIKSYEISAVTGGASAPIGTATGTSLTIKAGELAYGTQVAFTVVSINDKGAGSGVSPTSNTVTPYTRPSAVKTLAATTVANQKGAVRATWGAADDNGRPITGYEVTANGAKQTVTGTSVTLNGFADGVNVTVAVLAINVAGKGPASSKVAKTISPPTITATGRTITYNSMSLAFATDTGGGAATCAVSVNGGAASALSCTGGTVGGLWPGTAYSYTVTITNAAGSANYAEAQTSPILKGTVGCSGCPNGVGIYTRPWQDTSSFSSPDAQDNDKYRALCKIEGMDGNQSPSATINAAGENHNKSSAWWVQLKNVPETKNTVSNSGNRYMPYAFFDLDAGDNLNMIPHC
ncbi:hypothetical protein F4553_002543 [Allocatelliglobosispora scoriae]|uniref:Fibronectin type-III domain-containing protein n=1 Tax=Allocatelliglobosispora scoriae TaxID=643052 RepID=A0A841BLK1_9ACTN|nr:fibronectin type III domain-containing protein [Allocatelliglobosispora scoriae]MBB5869164.1 hypothetical protein [Allocatelliglobosispora scoriae]